MITSSREGRWWLAVAVVVAAIYASAGVAGRLADALEGSVWLALAFGLCFFTVISVIAASGLSGRASGREVWVGLGVVAVYAMVFVRMGVTAAERTHLFEFGLVAVLIHRALGERFAGQGRVLAPAVIAVVSTALLGWIDEAIQWLLPNRVYDLRDVGFNALAGLMAVATSLALAWARRRRGH